MDPLHLAVPPFARHRLDRWRPEPALKMLGRLTQQVLATVRRTLALRVSVTGGGGLGRDLARTRCLAARGLVKGERGPVGQVDA